MRVFRQVRGVSKHRQARALRTHVDASAGIPQVVRVVKERRARRLLERLMDRPAEKVAFLFAKRSMDQSAPWLHDLRTAVKI